MLKGITTCVLLIVCAACSMPETQIYSLHIPAGKVSANRHSDASLAILIRSPRYLTQPYIAYRNSPYQLSISKYSKWDSSPDEMVSQAFKDSLSTSGLFREVRTSHVVPGGFYSLKINLKHCERVDEGSDSFGDLSFEATLLSPDGREIYQGNVTKRTKLEDKSFASLAKGLSSTLAEGVEEIRGNLKMALRQ